jgi:hypothetical protein
MSVIGKRGDCVRGIDRDKLQCKAMRQGYWYICAVVKIYFLQSVKAKLCQCDIQSCKIANQAWMEGSELRRDGEGISYQNLVVKKVVPAWWMRVVRVVVVDGSW